MAWQFTSETCARSFSGSVADAATAREATLRLISVPAPATIAIPEGSPSLGSERRARTARHLRQRENQLGICRGSGAYLQNDRGDRWIDLSAGTLNLALGYCDPDVADAHDGQMRELSYASSRFTPPITYELMDLIAEHIAHPACSVYSFKLSNGSDANEALVKAARRFTGRRTMLVQFESHLGESAETHSLSGKDFSTKLNICGSQDRQFITPPDCRRCPFGKRPSTCDVECVADAEARIRYMRDDLAGVLVEPVIVNRGVLVSERTHEYLTRLQAAAQSAGVPFLVDEIQSWPWVDGQTFTSYFGLSPDGQSFAKGISGGLAIAVAAMRPALADALEFNDAEHTNGAGPPACAGAAASIRKLVAADWGVRAKGELVGSFLNELQSLTGVAAVRRIGLIGAIEFDGRISDAAELCDRVYQTALDRGVILRRAGRSLLIKPPVIIQPQDLLNALEVVGDTIRDANAR